MCVQGEGYQAQELKFLVDGGSAGKEESLGAGALGGVGGQTRGTEG